MEFRQSEYDTLVWPIERQMVRTVWRIVRDPDEAADAFQQAMVTILKRWAKIRKHPNPQALMVTICVHAAFDRLRERSRRSRREVLGEVNENHICGEPRADERLVAEETMAAIHGAIAGLPPMQGAAVSLRLLSDLPFGAIGQALGCSEVTARTNYMRALTKLRGQLARQAPQAHEEAS